MGIETATLSVGRLRSQSCYVPPQSRANMSDASTKSAMKRQTVLLSKRIRVMEAAAAKAIRSQPASMDSALLHSTSFGGMLKHAEEVSMACHVKPHIGQERARAMTAPCMVTTASAADAPESAAEAATEPVATADIAQDESTLSAGRIRRSAQRARFPSRRTCIADLISYYAREENAPLATVAATAKLHLVTSPSQSMSCGSRTSSSCTSLAFSDNEQDKSTRRDPSEHTFTDSVAEVATMNMLDGQAVRSLDRAIQFLLANDFSAEDVCSVLAHACAYFESYRKTLPGRAIRQRQAVHIFIVQMYLAHCFATDDAVPIKTWHRRLSNDYCTLDQFNAVTWRLMKTRDYKLKLQDGDFRKRYDRLWADFHHRKAATAHE